LKSTLITAVFALFAVLCHHGPAGAARDGSYDDGGRGRLTGSVGAGFDSFQEKYTIVDEDTLDSITEFRSRLSLGYVAGSLFEDFFHLEGRTLLGDDSYETTGRFKVAKRLGNEHYFRIGIDGEIIRRTFRDNSSYEYGNDYARYYFCFSLKKVLSNVVSVRLSDRFEHQDFDKRTEFDYDYARNSVTLNGDFDWGLATFLNTGVTLTTKSVPDSTAIGYTSISPALEFRHDAGINKRMLVFTSFERRDYQNDDVRSPYWALFAVTSVRWPVAGPYALSVGNDVEYYGYDSSSDVYFDYVENKSALLLDYSRSWSSRVGAGPTYGFFISDYSRDDEYREYGVKCAVDYNKGTRAWFSVEYETGKRRYSAYAGAREESIFSDYTYNRVTAFTNVKLWNGLSLSGLLDYQPEDHEREGDDATATLFSLSVTYIF